LIVEAGCGKKARRRRTKMHYDTALRVYTSKRIEEIAKFYLNYIRGQGLASGEEGKRGNPNPFMEQGDLLRSRDLRRFD
jgi:hypothetical protein